MFTVIEILKGLVEVVGGSFKSEEVAISIAQDSDGYCVVVNERDEVVYRNCRSMRRK